MAMDHKSILRGETHPLPSPLLLHEYFFREVMSRNADADASGLTFQGKSLSFGEVARQSSLASRALRQKLQHKLSNHEIGQTVIVVDIEPCNELIIILLAIMKIGAAFLPVDSHSAINRVRYILNESRPLCIISDSASVFRQDSETLWCQFTVIEMEQLLLPDTPGVADGRTPCDMMKTDEIVDDGTRVVGERAMLACIIYTSGSTGNPKGVMISHQAVMNRLSWQWKTLPFSDNEHCCFKTSLLFVDSVVEIFAPILQLTPLVVAPAGAATNPETFVQLLQEHNITRLTTVPSLLRNLVFYLSVSSYRDKLADLSLIITNSETLNPSMFRKFFDVFPEGKTLCNLYGSTETMADVTCQVFEGVHDIDDKSYDGYLSVGKPMHNTTVLITDASSNILPVGELGEICVTGFNVAQGYVGDVNSFAFTANIHEDIDGFRVLYKTGDFGRILKGMIIMEGRRDSQVKIRGQRVNISEIERAVNECSLVDKAVVLCHHFSESTDIIIAYYKPVPGAKRTQTESEVSRKCIKDLPVYMRPKLLHVEDIPLQRHSGKTDRVALRRIYEKAFNRQSSDELAIMDEKGEKAMNIIALNLNLPKHTIPKKRSFFELGGNSVTMISTIVQLKQHNLHIPLDAFSRAKTIHDIIELVSVSTAPIGEILHAGEYIVKPLHHVPNNHVIIDILADSFIKKEPLDVLLGVTKSEFMVFAKSLHREALRGDLSFIVMDKDSGEIVGGDFLFNYYAGVNVDHHQSMAPLLHLMRAFEGPVRDRLAQEGRGQLIYNYCLCVHKDLPHTEQVKICHLIEENVLLVAERSGYSGVLTNNTNPVTQDICQYFFNYQVLSSYRVRDFLFNGHQVFQHAPEDYEIKMMMKLL